jgi:hypothetical protein
MGSESFVSTLWRIDNKSKDQLWVVASDLDEAREVALEHFEIDEDSDITEVDIVAVATP